jgi:F-type H+-transporting ATPase subunit c
MKLLSYAALAVLAMLVFVEPSFAQSAELGTKYSGTNAGIGIGLSIIGAGIGIGLVGFSALSAIARQPEQSGTIRGAMILLAALIEGAALIGAVLVFATAFVSK